MKLRKMPGEAFETESTMIGEASHLEHEAKILNRLIGVTKEGWEIGVGLEKAKGLTTPGVDEPLVEEDQELTGWNAFQFSSSAARANGLASDRPDIITPIKRLCRAIAKPTEESCQKLCWLPMFLIHKPRLILLYRWQDPVGEISTRSAANLAGCLKSRKLTSGGVVTLGGALAEVLAKDVNEHRLVVGGKRVLRHTQSRTRVSWDYPHGPRIQSGSQ